MTFFNYPKPFIFFMAARNRWDSLLAIDFVTVEYYKP